MTVGLQKTIHEFEKIDEQIELRPILDYLAASPPLDLSLSDDTQARLPVIFGGLSVARARTLKILDPDLRRVHSDEWDRAFRIFDLLI